MLNRLRLMVSSLGGGLIALYMVWLVLVDGASFSPWTWFILGVFLFGTLAMAVEASRTKRTIHPWADALEGLGFVSLRDRANTALNQWVLQMESICCRVVESTESGQRVMRLELELETEASEEWFNARLSTISASPGPKRFDRPSAPLNPTWVVRGHLAYCEVEHPADLTHLVTKIRDLSE